MESVFDIRKARNMNLIELKKSSYVKKAIAGNKEAFAKIVKENKIYLYKTAFMYVKDEEKALEVLHETISRAFINIKKLENPNYFKTWITRILINVSINALKESSRTIELSDDIVIEKANGSISYEEKIDLYKAVDLLKENYKTVIIMKYFNDMKIKDISEVMEIPESTVKTYLSRAKRELRDILQEGYLND